MENSREFKILEKMTLDDFWKELPKVKVTSGSQLVWLGKTISRIVGTLRINNDVNFTGASDYYVHEKLTIAKNDIEWIMSALKDISKWQQRERDTLEMDKILKLKAEGLSKEEIYKQTYFSKVKVGKIMKENFPF